MVTDINGKISHKLLEKIIANEIPDSAEVSQMIHGRLRPKLDQLMETINGITTPLQRRLLAQIMDHIDDLNRRVAVLDEMVKEYMAEYEVAIAARRGKNWATVAVAHSMLIAIYHVLKSNVPFHNLGSDYYDTFNHEHKIKSYLKRLQALGWQLDAKILSA